MKKLLFLSFFYLIFYATNIDCLFTRVCDGDNIQISCDPGTTLRINSAYYLTEENNVCFPDTSYDVVSRLCNKQSCCVFPVASHMFATNSCRVGTPKCLTIYYTCKVDNSGPKACRKNEEWSDCRSACPEMCPDSNDPDPQWKWCTKQCVCPGTVCVNGTVRDRRTGYCIKREFCPKPGDKHEVFSKCANSQCSCPIWAKPVPGTTITTPAPFPGCEPGYVCDYPYLRDPFSGWCVVREGCPLIT